MEKKARLKVFFLLICTLNAESVSITSDGNGAEHNQLAYYRVKLKDRKAANQSEIDSRYRKYIPQGCYGQKQLRSLKNGTSRIPYQPQPPDWCSEGSNLVPKKYSDQTEPQKSPSPYKINVYPFQKSETFKVVVKSPTQNVHLVEAILVARKVDENGDITEPKNRGRFVPSAGVELVCCSFIDKDAAWYQSKGSHSSEAVFFWIPEGISLTNDDTDTEDFEGSFVFLAMIAKSSTEYWVNVKSKIQTFVDFDISKPER